MEIIEINSESELQEIIESNQRSSVSEIVVFRGQESDHRIIPSAARNEMYKIFRNFDYYYSDLREHVNNLTHIHVNNTYKDVINDIYPELEGLKNVDNIEYFNEFQNYLIQFLLQQYGRNCFFIDVTKDIKTALWFSSHKEISSVNFYTPDYRKIRKLTKTEQEYVYLYGFRINKEYCIYYNTDANDMKQYFESYVKYKKKMKQKIIENEEFINMPILFDLSFYYSNFSRIKNQQSLFLSKLPRNDCDQRLIHYDLTDLVIVKYKILSEIIGNTIKEVNFEELFPADDLILNKTKEKEAGRKKIVYNNFVATDYDYFLNVSDYVYENNLGS